MLNVFRSFFMLLDTIVYGILEIMFQLVIDLANYQLFNTEILNKFANRIYLILGLVMVFKLMISFIQILINPDKMNDKEQGLTGLLRRVVISMILMVLIRPIFDLARDLQERIIVVIPKVILGVSLDVSDEQVAKESGKVMAYYSFLPFFYYYDGCNNGHLYGTGDNSQATIFSAADALKEVNDKTCTVSSNGYTYRYQFFISTIVGGYLVYVLVTIIVAVAIRAIKLALCEIIAPIPIASYVDPKLSAKAFNTWVSTTLKVYLDLFIRLCVVYFIIYIFQLLFNGSGNGSFIGLTAKYGNDSFRALLVLLFVIIGLLNFAKEMPKFVSSMLGIPDGFGDIAEMFKGAGFSQIKTAVGGAAGMVANPVSTALTNFNTAKAMGGNKFDALKHAAGGFVAGAGRSTAAAIGGKGWQGAYKDAKGQTTANARRKMQRTIQTRDAKQLYKSNMEKYNEQMEAYNNRGSQKIALQNEISNYQSNIESLRQTESYWEQQWMKAQSEGNTEAANTYAQRKQEVATARMKMEEKTASLNEQIEALDKMKAPVEPVRPSSYGVGKFSAAAKEFAGIPTANSTTIRAAADLMNTGKSKIFNAAKQKVSEKPTLISNVIEFKDDKGNSYGSGKFETIFNAYKNLSEGVLKVDADGRIIEGEFAGRTRSELESIYGNAWKDASAIYIDKVMDGQLENETLRQDITQWESKYNNDTVIDAADRADIDARMKKARQDSIDKSKTENRTERGEGIGLGNFFKASDDIGARLNTIAMERERTELPPKKDN